MSPAGPCGEAWDTCVIDPGVAEGLPPGLGCLWANRG